MTKKDRIGQMKEAADLIAEALGLIREATGEDAHVEQYVCASLSTLIGEGKYLSCDMTIEGITEEMEDGEYATKDEEDDDWDSEFCDCCGSYMGKTGKCPDPDCDEYDDGDDDDGDDDWDSVHTIYKK